VSPAARNPGKCAYVTAGNTSLSSFRAYDGLSGLYAHHGEINIAPASGWESTGGGGMDGSGCRRCDASWRTRFPPAESPPMTTFPGEMPLLRRCESAALACFNWVGNGESGVNAIRAVFKNVCGADSDGTHSTPTLRRRCHRRKRIRLSVERARMENSPVAQAG